MERWPLRIRPDHARGRSVDRAQRRRRSGHGEGHTRAVRGNGQIQGDRGKDLESPGHCGRTPARSEHARNGRVRSEAEIAAGNGGHGGNGITTEERRNGGASSKRNLRFSASPFVIPFPPYSPFPPIRRAA